MVSFKIGECVVLLIIEEERMQIRENGWYHWIRRIEKV